ncbi:2-oxo acid dehydrogenase subunit E2 [Nitrospira sp.]|nr:2-oxo acid dehydrogenase subunit E2 [Nitrospira sp.]
MATDILMPQLGESIAEGTVVTWLIALGDTIEKDQPLLEVETDKVALEIPAPATGTLTEILVPQGDTVPVGTLLARLDSQPSAGVVNRVGGVVVKPVEQSSGTGEHFSPAVRRLAKEHGVDLSKVTGSGDGGRVTKKDVLEFVGAMETIASAPATPKGERIVPLTQMRKTIAERMVSSRRSAAHVATFFEADFSGIVRFREGRELTFPPFVVSAVARALLDVPVLNSCWTDAGIVIKQDIDMGIAVALDDGLLVPVLRQADRKGLAQIAKEIGDLANRARKKQLEPDEVQGGTFTITNHGGFGSLFSTPIINQPQAAILGVGAVQKRAVVIHDAIAIRPMCYLSLSFDHRVLDGATADQFMAKAKGYLEQSEWEKLL